MQCMQIRGATPARAQVQITCIHTHARPRAHVWMSECALVCMRIGISGCGIPALQRRLE